MIVIQRYTDVKAIQTYSFDDQRERLTAQTSWIGKLFSQGELTHSGWTQFLRLHKEISLRCHQGDSHSELPYLQTLANDGHRSRKMKGWGQHCWGLWACWPDAKPPAAGLQWENKTGHTATNRRRKILQSVPVKLTSKKATGDPQESRHLQEISFLEWKQWTCSFAFADLCKAAGSLHQARLANDSDVRQVGTPLHHYVTICLLVCLPPSLCDYEPIYTWY